MITTKNKVALNIANKYLLPKQVKENGVKEGELSRASKIINYKFINRITRQYIDDQLTLDEAVDEINTVLASF